MMVRSIKGGRWTAAFRPRRLVRFFGAGFLGVGLLVWAVGQAFALGVLLASLDILGGSRLLHALTSLGASIAAGLAAQVAWREIPGPQNAGALALSFIASWLAIWTAAGVMAGFQLMRVLASEDHVAWDGAGVEVFRRLGPFRSRRAWRADQIEHVSLSRPDRALLLHAPRATYVLTEWGSQAERAAVQIGRAHV